MLEFILKYISVQNLLWLTVLLPFLSFVVNGIVALVTNSRGKTEPRAFVIFISQFSTLISFVSIIIVWYILYSLEDVSPSVITGSLFSWKGFLSQPLEFGLKADQLSLVIAFMIAFVGFLIHIYSVGFLAKRKKVSPFFSLLNVVYTLALFLVFTDSLFIFFIVWQLMAVAGYVAISRFFTDIYGVKSATFYYVTEVMSGSAFILVMFLVWKAFVNQTGLNEDIFRYVSLQVGSGLLLQHANVICIALLIAVLIRSVQFPLYIWITGATSANISQFTLLYGICSVLIPVYLLIRLNFLLVLSPKILGVIGVLGALGALYGGISALVQRNAKKVLAYFILSQIGLAFVGVGVGAFATSLFHLFTHAMYASSLLLGIGSVIAITDTDSIDVVSGLRMVLPVTFWTTLVGAISAIGIYPFSGFFGKNGIIWEAYQRGHILLFLASFVSVILVAIAIFRIVALIFFGKKKIGALENKRVEESSVSMLVAMVITAFGSIVVGWFGVSRAFGGGDHFREWLEPGLATQMVHIIGEGGRFSELVLAVIVTLFVAHAGLVTWIIYVHKRKWAAGLALRFEKTHKVLCNGLYLNELYRIAVVKPLSFINKWVVWKGIDRLLVGGVIVGSVGRGIRLLGDVISRYRMETLAGYIFWVVVSLVVLMSWLIL